MHRLFQLSTVLSLSLLSSCAAIFTGTSQSIMVETQPAGADCRISKGGMLIGEVTRTPGTIRVHRDSEGLEIACTKPGYALSQAPQPTQIEGWVFGNIVVGGVFGIVIDFATGAAFRYDDAAMLTMNQVPYGEGPVLSSNGPANGNGYTYQPLTRVYPVRTDAADPIVSAPSTPEGDVTYHWRSAE